MTPKSANPNPEPDDAEQSKQFEDAARRLEADESGKVFKMAFGVVVKHTDAAKSNEPLTSKTTQTIVTDKRKGSRK